MGEESWGVV